MKAVASEGDIKVDMIVVVTDDTPPAPPCAVCLQVLAEFCTPSTQVFLYAIDGDNRHFTFKDLLPHPFIFPTERNRRL